MNKPRICAVIIDKEAAVAEIEPLADLWELRIDRVGDGWEDVSGRLTKPWIATNRLAEEGGRWRESEARRKEELLKALGLGAAIIDIELGTRNLDKIVPLIKKRAECLISYHNMDSTPPFERLKKIVARQLAAGADIAKVVTTAASFEDNLTVLKLIGEFPQDRIIAFCMGPEGRLGRVLCPLLGGQFTYAAIGEGGQSASGQLTVSQLASLYNMVIK
jgi:3-dehydroquinate dehydratase type I